MEKTFNIGTINPVGFFGVNNVNIDTICKFYPKLKIIARGTIIKVIGEESEIIDFEAKIDYLIRQFEKNGNFSTSTIEHLFMNSDVNIDDMTETSIDILVHGRNGMQIKARTINQQKMVEATLHSDLIFAIGPAGTGKTYTAVALAVRALKNREVKRIILTRPAVEAGENLGFLPGDMKEKLDPYLQPLYDALLDMIPPAKLASYLEDKTIEIAPLAFMRGRTLDNAYAILDEAQNATQSQLKMFVTRMGRSAKFMVTGDITQIDLPKNQPSGLLQALKVLNNIKGIDFIHLDERDVVRHGLVVKILKAYQKENQ